MQTIYLIKDVGGETIFENENKYCFAEIFSWESYDSYLPKLSLAHPDLVLEFLVDETLSKEDIDSFVEKISKIKVVKVSIREVSKSNFKHKNIGECNSKYKAILKREDYKSDHLFKLAVHLLRPLVETSALLTKFLKPTPDNVDDFQWYRIQSCVGDFIPTHNTFSGIIPYYGRYSNGTNRSYANPDIETFNERVGRYDFANCLSKSIEYFKSAKAIEYKGETEENLIKQAREFKETYKETDFKETYQD